MIVSAASALLELYKTAKPHLTTEQLEWLSNLTTLAELEAGNLAETIRALANSDATEQMTEEEMSSILFGFADRAKSIAIFVAIGTEARSMAAERKSVEQ